MNILILNHRIFIWISFQTYFGHADEYSNSIKLQNIYLDILSNVLWTPWSNHFSIFTAWLKVQQNILILKTEYLSGYFFQTYFGFGNHFSILTVWLSSAGDLTRIEICNFGFSNIQRDSFDTDKKALENTVYIQKNSQRLNQVYVHCI